MWNGFWESTAWIRKIANDWSWYCMNRGGLGIQPDLVLQFNGTGMKECTIHKWSIIGHPVAELYCGGGADWSLHSTKHMTLYIQMYTQIDNNDKWHSITGVTEWNNNPVPRPPKLMISAIPLFPLVWSGFSLPDYGKLNMLVYHCVYGLQCSRVFLVPFHPEALKS